MAKNAGKYENEFALASGEKLAQHPARGKEKNHRRKTTRGIARG
jgi:hypothetical protein